VRFLLLVMYVWAGMRSIYRMLTSQTRIYQANGIVSDLSTSMFNPLEIPTKSSCRVQLRLEQHGNDQKGQQRQMVGARILMLLASSVHLESKRTHSHLETKGKISEVALILPFLQAALYNVFQSYENLFISFQRSSSHVFMMLLFQFLYSSLHRRLRLTEIFGGVTLHLQCPHLSAYRTVR
jgi:hypothetical protein